MKSEIKFKIIKKMKNCHIKWGEKINYKPGENVTGHSAHAHIGGMKKMRPRDTKPLSRGHAGDALISTGKKIQLTCFRAGTGCQG